MSRTLKYDTICKKKILLRLFYSFPLYIFNIFDILYPILAFRHILNFFQHIYANLEN